MARRQKRTTAAAVGAFGLFPASPGHKVTDLPATGLSAAAIEAALPKLRDNDGDQVRVCRQSGEQRRFTFAFRSRS